MKLVGSELSESDAGAVIKTATFKSKPCNHFKVVVDEHLSELLCEGCGNRINPVWWIGNNWREIKNRRLHAALYISGKINASNRARQALKIGIKSYKELWELANMELTAKTIELNNLKASLPLKK